MKAVVLGVLLTMLTALAARAQTWPDIHEDLAPQGGGEADAALVVGISDYVYLPKIAGAADNAAAWQQWFARTRKVPGERVVILRDKEATRERILKNLERMTSAVGKGGKLWFIFVGHGAPSPTGDDGLLLGADTDTDADSLSARGVSQKEVMAIVDGGAQANSVLLFDACFSGKTADGEAPLVRGLQATLPVRKSSSGTPANAIVLSSSETFAGPLPSGDKPAFSYLMLGALRGWADENGDKQITVEEAFAFSRGTLQAGFKADSRLPSRRGPASILALNAREARPDVDAILVGRCPARMGWDGTKCSASAVVASVPKAAVGSLEGTFQTDRTRMQIFRQGPAYGVLRTVDGATEAGVVFERDGVIVGAVGNGRFGATLFQVDGGVVRALRSADTDGFYVPEAIDVYAGPPGLNGSYTVTVGQFANGNRYAGVVNIRPLGDDLYRLEWTTATAKWTAIGVLAGDKLAVSWGSEGVGAVMLYERRGSSLDGRIVRFDFARKSAVHERFQLLP